ncbi:hypothetical protein [Opacimonas viscosa]|uniref:CopL family metal-binding regulatory protein n=1 Tax=Opacimonas viscosa TaxID=2961944 RepID=A0AA41X097_9ALTE|nr:hypothetical protein [Opacimonas viscosa]MCP3429545.1 hypothetical protein [Opacimonas viscosa]
MKMPKQFVKFFMILMLLITQISGAFASAQVFSAMSDTSCSMSNLSHHALQSASETESMSEHMMLEQSKRATMDCCDSVDMNICCDGQCACVAVAATAVFIFGSLSEDHLPNINETFIESSPPPHSAFSALLMRPPIQSLA